MARCQNARRCTFSDRADWRSLGLMGLCSWLADAGRRHRTAQPSAIRSVRPAQHARCSLHQGHVRSREPDLCRNMAAQFRPKSIHPEELGPRRKFRRPRRIGRQQHVDFQLARGAHRSRPAITDDMDGRPIVGVNVSTLWIDQLYGNDNEGIRRAIAHGEFKIHAIVTLPSLKNNFRSMFFHRRDPAEYGAAGATKQASDSGPLHSERLLVVFPSGDSRPVADCESAAGRFWQPTQSRTAASRRFPTYPRRITPARGDKHALR